MRTLTQTEVETLAALRMEHQDLGAESNAIKASRNNTLSIGSTLLVGGFFYLLKEQNYWLVATIPFLFGGVLLFSLQLMANSRALGGYRHYLELRMNAILGGRTVYWEEVAKATMRETGVYAALFFATLYVALTASATALSFRVLPAWAMALQGTATAVMSVTLAFSSRSARSAYDYGMRHAPLLNPTTESVAKPGDAPLEPPLEVVARSR